MFGYLPWDFRASRKLICYLLNVILCYQLLQFIVMVYVLYSRVGPVILGTPESTMPWVYCYLIMNQVEEWSSRSLLHFWIWERHSILLIMVYCSNVFINWAFAVLKFNDSPQWSCPVSKVQSLLLWLGTCFGRNSPREHPRIPLIFDLCEWYALNNTEWVTSAVWWRLVWSAMVMIIITQVIN